MSGISRAMVIGLIGCVLSIQSMDVHAAKVSSSAKTACMVAVNDNYGGNVSNIKVIHTEYSEANSVVAIKADGERWRCLVSNDGQVQELTAKAARTREAPSNVESACMSAVNYNYGGNVDKLVVLKSEYSEANSVVTLKADGERWRCLASNDGDIEELRVLN